MQNLSTWGVVGWGVPFRPLYLQVKAVVYHVVHGYSVPPAPCVYLFSSLGILALIIWGRKRIDPGFVAYLIAGMLLIHSREPWSPRHELMLFPAYLLLPQTFLVRRWIAPIATAV